MNLNAANMIAADQYNQRDVNITSHELMTTIAHPVIIHAPGYDPDAPFQYPPRQRLVPVY